jgi:hypothetical protein
MYTVDNVDRIVALPVFPPPSMHEPFLARGDIELSFVYAVSEDYIPLRDITMPLVPGINEPPACTISWRDGWYSENAAMRRENVHEDWNRNPQEARRRGMKLFAFIETEDVPGHIYQCYDYEKKYPPFAAHPLVNRGLHQHGVFLVENSSWLRHLQTVIPDEFPSHRFEEFDEHGEGIRSVRRTYSHLIFTFETATLEFISARLTCELAWATKEEAQSEVGMTKWLMA